MKKRIISILASALMVGAIVAPASQAQTAGAGGVAFQGIADLASFPCDPGPCNGTFDGTASGSVSGVNGGTAWSANFVNASMTASFNYREPVATCPATGVANGSFDIEGGASVGVYGNNVNARVWAEGDFSWERVGIAANVATRNLYIYFSFNGDATAEVRVGPFRNRAVAAFAPLGVAHCDAPGPLQAAVVGVDLIPDPLP